MLEIKNLKDSLGIFSYLCLSSFPILIPMNTFNSKLINDVVVLMLDNNVQYYVNEVHFYNETFYKKIANVFKECYVQIL